MRAYVLGVPDQFRGDVLVEHLRALGFETRVVWGRSGASATRGDIDALLDSRRSAIAFGRELTPSEVCCVEGHARILREVAAANSDWALVLEDDVVVTSALAAAATAVQRLPIGRHVVIGRSNAEYYRTTPLQRQGPSGIRRAAERRRLLFCQSKSGAVRDT